MDRFGEVRVFLRDPLFPLPFMDSFKISVAAVILFAAMIAGYVAAGQVKKIVPPPTTTGATASVAAIDEVIPGWCCKSGSATCVAEKKNPILCLRNGGRVFNEQKDPCDKACAILSASK